MRLIDILNKIANGELKEGTKVKYKEYEYIYKDDALLRETEDNFYFVDLLDEITLLNLTKEVELIEPQELTVNIKIEELDESKYILKGMADVVVDTFYKLNEVIKKVNTQTTVLLAQEKEIEDIKEQLDY